MEFVAANVREMRELARRRLPRGLFEFVERGAEDDRAMQGNRRAYEDCRLVTRVFRNVEKVDQRALLFGAQISSPVVIAPTGAASLLWHEGDLALARAAAAAQVPFTISTGSSIDVEKIAAIGARTWFQLYYWQDRALTYAALDRAKAAGCETLMVTADIPVQANREFLARNGFALPFRLGVRNALDMLAHPRWLAGVLLRYALGDGLPGQANLPAGIRTKFTAMPPAGVMFRNDNLDWDDIADLRRRWSGPLVVKGILHPDDARKAVAMGADGIVVSNHGGRALDAAVAALHAFPAIADAVGGKTTLLLDGGIRRGSDAVKALAMGADAIMIGRPALYGLAADGERGVARVLAIFREEIARVMAQTGSRELSEITRELLHAPA